jgi:hypothetical protein
MNSTYARQGFVIYRNLTIQNTIKNIVQFIKFNFGLEANCSEDELHFRMRSLLKKNKDEYVSTLKAIVQSPIVYEFVCNQELLSISNDLGVKSPILATSPVLHMVKAS